RAAHLGVEHVRELLRIRSVDDELVAFAIERHLALLQGGFVQRAVRHDEKRVQLRARFEFLRIAFGGDDFARADIETDARTRACASLRAATRRIAGLRSQIGSVFHRSTLACLESSNWVHAQRSPLPQRTATILDSASAARGAPHRRLWRARALRLPTIDPRRANRATARRASSRNHRRSGTRTALRSASAARTGSAGRTPRTGIRAPSRGDTR